MVATEASMIVVTHAVIIHTFVRRSDTWGYIVNLTLASFKSRRETDFSNTIPFNLFKKAYRLHLAIALLVIVRDCFIHTSWPHFLCKKNEISGDIRHIRRASNAVLLMFTRAYLMIHGSRYVWDWWVDNKICWNPTTIVNYHCMFGTSVCRARRMWNLNWGGCIKRKFVGTVHVSNQVGPWFFLVTMWGR